MQGKARSTTGARGRTPGARDPAHAGAHGRRRAPSAGPELSSSGAASTVPGRMASQPKRLSHVDARGRARMVDVGDKAVTARLAVAGARVRMRPATLRLIVSGEVPKGDVLAVARVAGIAAAKETSRLIPLCHPLLISHVEVEFRPDVARGVLDVEASVRLEGRTGAEMEALTAVTVAGLTVYDMCKAVDRAMEITAVRLLRKSGGKTGTFVRRRGPA
jgi:cyclic pyranopterin phosphate synthase